MAGTRAGNIFRGKVAATRIQGIMRIVGRAAFERHRRELGRLFKEVTGEDAVRISDGDTVEALSIGWAATRKYLEHLIKE